MPFIITEMLKKYGYPTTLRATAIAIAILTGPLIPSLKGRLPVSSSNAVAATDWRFLKMPLFWIYSLSNIIYGLGFFFPSLYLPSYATSINLSATTGALLLALLSVSQVLGQFSFGYLSDRRIPINALLITSTFTSAVACLTLWRLAHSLAPLVVFALLYGFFGAGYTAMWARMGTKICDEPMAQMAMFSFFNVGKGIGNVSAGPMSAALMGYFVPNGHNEEEKYRAVILFTGCCMLCSGLVVGMWSLWLRIGRIGAGGVREGI
jgi:MFS family permease